MENKVEEPAFKYNYTSPAEYLAAERASEEKHEYFDGHIYAMSGASLKHNRITSNLISNIGQFLKEHPCEILPGDMRVSTPDHSSYMYPDALIVCDEPVLEDDKFDTLLNPVVIFEILSPSTRSIDKGRKFFFYQKIASLKEYIMLDSLTMMIQYSQKQPNGTWVLQTITEGHLFIESVGLQLNLSDIYSGIEF